MLPGRARHMRAATSARLLNTERAYSWISLPVMPAAMPAPMIAPIEEPAIATGLMPSSSSASMTWMCASPRAPPPPNATAKVGEDLASYSPASSRCAGCVLHPPLPGVSGPSIITAGFDRQQFPGRRLHLVQRDRIDDVAAALDVVDAELVDLQFDQRARDGAGRIQIVDGVGADDIFLGGVQLCLRSARPRPSSPQSPR